MRGGMPPSAGGSGAPPGAPQPGAAPSQMPSQMQYNAAAISAMSSMSSAAQAQAAAVAAQQQQQQQQGGQPRVYTFHAPVGGQPLMMLHGQMPVSAAETSIVAYFTS
jgi:hypothetical protein